MPAISLDERRTAPCNINELAAKHASSRQIPVLIGPNDLIGQCCGEDSGEVRFV